MRDYKTFIFEKYHFDWGTGKGVFTYSYDDVFFFDEEIIVPLPDGFDYSLLSLDVKDVLENILFHIHLVAGIVYWKAHVFSHLKIKSGFLSKNTADFLNVLYRDGLSQFYFENNLDPEKYAPDFISYISLKDPVARGNGMDRGRDEKLFYADRQQKVLLPWGGGKDSVVSSFILDACGQDYVLFSVRESRIQKETAECNGHMYLVANRKISHDFITYQNKNSSVYKGHVPITAYYSFIELFAAVIYGFRQIILSNEKSADEGNLTWNGFVVNHQWSKTVEFEKLFRDYVQGNIMSTINYFSIVRPWYEIKIAEVFARYGQKYFGIFSSCNQNFKLDQKARLHDARWCNRCPKCAFVFLMLSVFLPRKDVVNIFGDNLFNEKFLEKYFFALIGMYDESSLVDGNSVCMKPLECVGTFAESRLAFLKVITRNEFTESAFIQKITPFILKQRQSLLDTEEDLFMFHKEHFVPDDYCDFMKNFN